MQAGSGRGASGNPLRGPGDAAMTAPVEASIQTLNRAVASLAFGPPVAFVYNPLDYAGDGYIRYLRKFGRAPKAVLLVGMNPGPWGMAQTGVPFGEVAAVRDWMGIEAAVGAPPAIHPKKPVDGFRCPKSEPSGRRLWGWVRERFGSPDAFFSHSSLPTTVRSCSWTTPVGTGRRTS